MRILPLGTTLQILPINEENITASGIILPNQYLQSYRKGYIEEKGTGDKWNNMSEFRKGDMVHYAKKAGVPCEIDNEKGETIEYLLVPYEKVTGIV